MQCTWYEHTITVFFGYIFGGGHTFLTCFDLIDTNSKSVKYVFITIPLYTLMENVSE